VQATCSMLLVQRPLANSTANRLLGRFGQCMGISRGCDFDEIQFGGLRRRLVVVSSAQQKPLIKTHHVSVYVIAGLKL
jgi:hypothetical protein